MFVPLSVSAMIQFFQLIDWDVLRDQSTFVLMLQIRLVFSKTYSSRSYVTTWSVNINRKTCRHTTSPTSTPLSHPIVDPHIPSHLHTPSHPIVDTTSHRHHLTPTPTPPNTHIPHPIVNLHTPPPTSTHTCDLVNLVLTTRRVTPKPRVCRDCKCRRTTTIPSSLDTIFHPTSPYTHKGNL